MNRYLSSFLITSIIYVLIVGVIFYYLNKEDTFHSEVKVKEVCKINFSILKPQKVQEVKPEPEKKPQPKPKPKKKPEPKKKVEPKPEPIQEPIIEELIIEEPIPEPEVIEEVLEEEVVEEIIEEVIEEVVSEVIEEIILEEAIEQEAISEQIQEVNSADLLKQKQDIFIANLVERINSNKSYPNMARRRSIEGSVEVKFQILSDGDVRGIEIITGKRVFKKSAVQAIERSFPMEIDSTLFKFPKEFKITIVYILR